MPLPGLVVKAYDKDLLFDDVLGSARADDAGRFEVVTELEDFREFFDVRPDIYFKVYAADGRTLIHETKDAVSWSSGRISQFEIDVPGQAHEAGEPAIELRGDEGGARDQFGPGESLIIAVTGLRPGRVHDIELSVDGDELFTSRLLTNLRGEIEPTVLWPQMGLDDPRGDARLTPEEAAERWGDTRVTMTLALDGKRLAEHAFGIGRELERPLVVSTDEQGRALNGFEVGSQALFVRLANLPFRGSVRIFLVRRQHDWRAGDGFEPAVLSDGRPAVVDVELPEPDDRAPIELVAAEALVPGAYDFIVRPVRYGFEEDDELALRRSDIVTRLTTGVVIREEFWTGKPVLGGCVNKIPISGRSIAGAPYLEYSDTFEVGESIYGAIDPGIIDPGNLSKMCAFYVVPNKTETEWNQSNGLSHLAALGGNAAVQKIKVQSGCVNANKLLLWPNATAVGEYDIVADFGNNQPDAVNFAPDDAYDTPLDAIDGYLVAGFRVVEDPGTLSDPGLFAGTWSYTETTVDAMGMAGTVSVDDEHDAYPTPGGFNVLTRQVRLTANVTFPADAPGVTDPAQISATKPDWPVVVIVHGNGQNYASYNFLLEHFARNGFVAASIDSRYVSGGAVVHGMHGLGRANNFFKHLAVLKQKFGSKLQNNIGVMGHSRGGEAVAKVARLNQEQGLGNGINALMSLAPTDRYGREVLAGPAAAPFFVLYGSRDGDVSGRHPSQIATPGFTWRATGFSLYDRATGGPKSMAFVYRATHNGFITANSDSNDNPLDPAVQQAVTQAYATAFFRQRLRGEQEWGGMFTGEWKPASVLASGAELYVQHRVPGGRVVDDFENAPAAWQSSTIQGMVSESGLPPQPPAAIAEDRLFDYPPNNPGLDPHSPHDSRGLNIRWDSPGDRVLWTIPAGQQDVTGFAALSLRLTQREASLSNLANQPQDLRVTLKDAANNERAIRVSAFGTIPYPDQRSTADLRKSALTTIRIPLTAYTIVCAGQPKVNLQNVVELALDFSITAAGEIQVDEIEFTN